MDIFGFTEADHPFRPTSSHLRDVVFQCVWEGPCSNITAMYADSAIKSGATYDQVKHAMSVGTTIGYQPDLAFQQAVDLVDRHYPTQVQH